MKSHILKIAFTGLMLVMFSSLRAQFINCGPGFVINNFRACAIKIQYEVSACQALPSQCSGIGVWCTNVVPIPANSSYTLPCCSDFPALFPNPTGCLVGGDISVWLMEIDGTDVTYGANLYMIGGGTCLGTGPTTAPVPGTVSAPCAIPSSYVLSFTPGSVDIW